MEVNYYKRYEPIDGKWYIKELLGEGSYGKVFRIEREDISGKYISVLKIISVPNSKTEVDSLKESLGDEQSVSDYYGEITKKLMQEFQLMSSLKGNSNIVSYEDHDIKQHEDGIGYDILIRMEFSHGVTVVAAAGNDNVDISKKFFSPACINGVVTVAAVADNNQKAKFSNYGNGIIDIAATGVKIGGAARGGSTVTMNGTSMASPHIAGVLALIRSANPNYSSTDAINAMKSSASNLGSSAYYGAGIPNLENLVSKTPVENNITVNTLEAKKISQTNATVYGKISYLGTRPSEVGIYFGNDSNNLNKVASDKINHNKNPFDMWYDLLVRQDNIYQRVELIIISVMQYRTEKKSEVQLAHLQQNQIIPVCQYQQAGRIRLHQIMQPSEVQRHIRVHVRVKSDYISEHRRII